MFYKIPFVLQFLSFPVLNGSGIREDIYHPVHVRRWSRSLMSVLHNLSSYIFFPAIILSDGPTLMFSKFPSGFWWSLCRVKRESVNMTISVVPILLRDGHPVSRKSCLWHWAAHPVTCSFSCPLTQFYMSLLGVRKAWFLHPLFSFLIVGPCISYMYGVKMNSSPTPILLIITPFRAMV